MIMNDMRKSSPVSRKSMALACLLCLIVSPSVKAFMVLKVLDYPGADMSYAYGINDAGVVVGGYRSSGVWHGYVYSGGTYTSYDVPVANTFQELRGINNNGDIVGRYADAGGNHHGFLLNGGVGGTFSTVDVPGYANNFLLGLNDRQAGGYGGSGPVLVGMTADGTWGTQLGVYWDAGGSHTFQYGTYQSQASSINNLNQIYGSYYNAGWHSMLGPSGGSMSEIAFPGATTTTGGGINDAGDIVGYYNVGGVDHGFAREGGIFRTADVSGASATYYSEVNESGVMVGYYSVGGVDHGVMALIPEPTTFSLVGLGVIFLNRRNRRTHA
jgi:hypothetical protein